MRAIAARPISAGRYMVTGECETTGGQLVARWNLVVPNAVLARTWAEPEVG